MLRIKLAFLTGIFILLFNEIGNANILSLSERDTVYISYSIAYFGEYGGANEGVIIFKDKGVLKARYVKYNSDNYNLSSFSLTKQCIIEYYTFLRNDYQVIKDNWVLDSTQIDFINSLIDDLKNYTPENGISNASEFYFLRIGGIEYVVIDRRGSWDKYKDIHKCFKIQVVKPRRIYFLGIKLRPQEVKYNIE